MCRALLFVCVFSTIFGVLNSHSSGNTCHKVKEEFRKISADDLVPDLPVIDEGLRICSRSLTAKQASCCSQDSEMKYLLAAEKYIVDSIRYRNSNLKRRITEHMGDYQGKLLALARHRLNSTTSKLTDWYSMPVTDHSPVVTNLFNNIEEFVKLKHVILKNSISTFFDMLFPVIFKNMIKQSLPEAWTHHFDHCLAKHRQELRPFGKYPDDIAKKLNHGLSLARAYLEALNIVMETINTTDNVLIEDECKHAVTRLQYCKHCHGFVDVKPCKGFCLDVMRGCLSKLSEIGPEWSFIISSVEDLVREMSGKSIDEVFKEFESGINDAILHSTLLAPNYYKRAHELCSIPLDTTPSTVEAKTPDFSKLQALEEVTGPLSIDVMQVTLELVDSKGLYSHLADEICAEQAKFEQDPLSGTCWNGSDISVYLRDAVDRDILSQARSNPEVKVSLVLDPSLRNLKEKMADVNVVLKSHMRKNDRLRPKNYMISDDPKLTIYGASGDGNQMGSINLAGGTTLGDDEDYNLLSGSGSGLDDGVDTAIDTGDIGNVDVLEIPNNSDREQYEVEQGGRLGNDPPNTRAPPNKKPKNTGDGNGASGAQFSVTWIFTALFFCLLQHWR
ncbi:glypican-5-like [Ruditapes philippinarum]|uniref:glypican-5-like n=1 Tax=Ruditapes philippinarum TaxID=129788 RepID=UPI00295B331F|nr:glypican-5-like [Ruditapes philippinarum]